MIMCWYFNCSPNNFNVIACILNLGFIFRVGLCHETFCISNGRCYSDLYRCDGARDCEDGSDERSCSLYFLIESIIVS